MCPGYKVHSSQDVGRGRTSSWGFWRKGILTVSASHINDKGLGNKFLDDLRAAHVLLHIIDVSGKTNEKGEETIGYDPINDAEWLESEIEKLCM